MDPRFAGSNLSEGDEFLRAIKIHSIPSFRGEVKLLAPCHKILWYIKNSCGVWQRYADKIHGHFSLLQSESTGG
jgi:hypothetical protein